MNVRKAIHFIRSYSHTHFYLMLRFKNFFRTSFLILLMGLFFLPSNLNSAAVAPKPKPPELPKVTPTPPPQPLPPLPPQPPTPPPAEQPLPPEIKNIPDPINIQPIEEIAKPNAAVNEVNIEWIPQNQTFVLYLFVIPLPDQYVLFMNPINWSSPVSDYIGTVSITEYVWGTPAFEPSNNMICPASDHTHWQPIKKGRIEKDDEGELSLVDKQKNNLDFDDLEDQLTSRDVDPSSQYSGLPPIEDTTMPSTTEETLTPDVSAVEPPGIEAIPPADEPPATVEISLPEPQSEVATPVENTPPPEVATEPPPTSEPYSTDIKTDDSWLKTFHENNDR